MRLSQAAFIAALSMVAATANAADRNVDIVNKTGQTMTQFYASVANANSWEENILGHDSLDDGDTQPVDIDDGSGKCVFDFKAVFKGGGTSEKRGINVCQVGTFTYTR